MARQITIPALEEVDLTNCDREPIHISGHIQPHGVLLVVREPQLEILQVSENTLHLLGFAPRKCDRSRFELILDRLD